MRNPGIFSLVPLRNCYIRSKTNEKSGVFLITRSLFLLHPSQDQWEIQGFSHYPPPGNYYIAQTAMRNPVFFSLVPLERWFPIYFAMAPVLLSQEVPRHLSISHILDIRLSRHHLTETFKQIPTLEFLKLKTMSPHVKQQILFTGICLYKRSPQFQQLRIVLMAGRLPIVAQLSRQKSKIFIMNWYGG